MLENGADPNLAWGNDGESPLHVAARRWDLTMVELLVQEPGATFVLSNPQKAIDYAYRAAAITTAAPSVALTRG